MQVRGILETCLYVDDLDAAERFYCSVLGIDLLSRQEDRHVFLRCGNRMLLLFNPKESSKMDGDLPPHGANGAGHLALAVPEIELEQWKEHLSTHGVDIEAEVDWPQGGRSLYFRDPAGNSLELATPRIWGIDEEKSE